MNAVETVDALIEPDTCCPSAMADRLAALSHPARIEILRHLASHDACCCKDVVQRLDLAQSTVSQHLKILVAAGLVRLTPERQRSRYEVNRAAIAALSRDVSSLLCACGASGTASAG